MWQQEKQDHGIVGLALLLALTTSPLATNLLMSVPVLAQSASETPSFPLPQTVADGTTLRIDGYSGFAGFNQKLQQSFEQNFSGTKVTVAANGTEAAIQALLNGQVDIAAIGRGLTPQEKAQGLEQVRLHREKIAIIVGAENPFKGSLTDREFARIFRGRITRWSQVGEANGKIRVLDRPDNSGTREALSNYPVFRATKFATGATATQIPDDNTTEIVKQLGKDGISYARANQVSKLPGVRVIRLHDTLPDDPKYPFSQPFVYVYKKDPSPAVAAFLGFALAPQGQQAIEAARVAEAEAIAKGESSVFLTATNPSSTPEITPGSTAAPTTETTAAATTSPTAAVTPESLTATTPPATNAPFIDSNNTSTVTNITQPSVVAPPENSPADGRNLLWWLLLPIGAIGGSLLWFMRRSPATSVDEESSLAADATTNQSSDISDIKDKVTSSPLPLPPELEQSPWDMEAPATIVNTSYPQIVDTPQAENVTNETLELVDNTELPSHQVNEVTPNLEMEEPETPGAAELSTTAVTDIPVNLADVTPENLDIADEESEWARETQPEVNNIDIDSLFENELVAPELYAEEGEDLPTVAPPYDEIPEDALNLVADEAEPMEHEILQETENTPPTNLASLAGGAAALGVGIGAWAVHQNQDTSTPETPENLETVDAVSGNLQNSEEPSSIVLKPRSPEWAYVSWYVCQSDRQQMTNDGVSQLTLRLYDVTELDLSYQDPYLVQQHEYEVAITDSYVSIPESDRNYLADIGYITDGDRWVTIACSDIVRVFSLPYTENLIADDSIPDEDSQIVFTPRTPKWAYISWEVSQNRQKILQDAGISQLALRLYDVTNIDLSYQTPQLIQQYECEEIIRDRYIAIPQSDRDYMVEIGYFTDGERWINIARSANVHVFSRPYGDFWFVADAELIIHGATEPGATVNIAGKPITLKPDGTFHLRVPFSEEVIDYLITVSAANGKQTTNLHKKFSQATLET
jgi:phosphate transport system substrate-binding protein